jgi:TIR domain
MKRIPLTCSRRDSHGLPVQSTYLLAVLCEWCHTLVMHGSRIQIFVSYAHDDWRHLEQFKEHTAELRRSQVLAFDDQEIKPGQRWKSVIANKLDSADIVVLLITVKFVASDFCYTVEFRRALEREEEGRCKIIPVNVGPVDLDPSDPLRTLQYVPRKRPISEMRSGRASAWKEVAQALRKCVAELRHSDSLELVDEDADQLPQNVVLLRPRTRSALPPGDSGVDGVSRPHYIRNYTKRRKPFDADRQDLIDILRVTRFDGTDWQSLAMSTGQLRQALGQIGTSNDSFPARAEEIALALLRTLAPVLSPSARQSSIHAACITCERLRTWLLDILATSGV